MRLLGLLILLLTACHIVTWDIKKTITDSNIRSDIFKGS